MQANEKQSLIDKIESLAPEARERVKGYVDALLEGGTAEKSSRMKSDSVERSEGNRRGGLENEEDRTHEHDPPASKKRFLCQDWAGALNDLKEEYTSLELEKEIERQWTKMARD